MAGVTFERVVLDLASRGPGPWSAILPEGPGPQPLILVPSFGPVYALWPKHMAKCVKNAARHRTPHRNGRQRLLLRRFTYVNDRVQQASERIQPGALIEIARSIMKRSIRPWACR